IEYARGVRPDFDGDGDGPIETVIEEGDSEDNDTLRSVAQIEGGLE
ncbi:acetolactate synthase 1 catalytic subunit, partial [Burkholderia multivorans]